MVRGKFRLNVVEDLTWSDTAKRYVFEAVCNDGTPENERFHKYTPTGRIEMVIDNPAAQAQYELAKCYYFDSTPAGD